VDENATDLVNVLAGKTIDVLDVSENSSNATNLVNDNGTVTVEQTAQYSALHFAQSIGYPGATTYGIWRQANLGTTFQGTGTVSDFAFINKNGQESIYNITGTQNIVMPGQLMIGTTTAPGSILHVYEGASGQGTPDAESQLVIENDGSVGINALITAGNQFEINVGDNGDADQMFMYFVEPLNEFQLGNSGTIRLAFESASQELGINTTAPRSNLHIDAAGGTDATGSRWQNASVSTTDGTATTIYTLATNSNLAYRIVADIAGAQDDGSNSMGATHSFTIKNVAGTVTEQGDASIQETDDSAGVSVSGAVSGTDYLIQVTGIAAENWNWEATIRITAMAH